MVLLFSKEGSLSYSRGARKNRPLVTVVEYFRGFVTAVPRISVFQQLSLLSESRDWNVGCKMVPTSWVNLTFEVVQLGLGFSSHCQVIQTENGES